MKQGFNLEQYLSNGVEKIVKNAIKATLKDPRESVFLAKYAVSSKEAAKKRRLAKENGENIPPFLIASITSNCNLYCAGCYSRANHACSDKAPVKQLTDEEWNHIFLEASQLGVSFILLAGGEPLLRKDVIKKAAKVPDVMFPIFTNGTMIDEEHYELFDKYRNLVPVFSVEGYQEKTDKRRGEGVYKRVSESMEKMKKEYLTFGASVTVTTENIEEVMSDGFVEALSNKGAKAVFYVEYVPVTEKTLGLAPGDKERELLKEKLTGIRGKYPEMIFIAFPGDEKTSGGCLAAGRGFFHINSKGGAEPCPFSPYSDINVRDTSLKEAMKSKLFLALQDENVLMEEHAGGCVLFQKKEQVEALVRR
ncbi:radical SAM protein [[Clostridium] polysaccharolyticum]|uniref:Radical SAM superfamily enzyme, MoaA/NifB/PqqE/SkfB family n=1 Tax=[Clostridium] polysaccharolyticum TaxID=29364 RepID=A0A1I0F8E9_9FIRM|nr:radical SAM protein [[Clostridium] polysaccharolyticum]SET53556.1 Radical SAM superfamily enzyme, MoaA/NifB/PqqE/SkfB family [[Clostridium] polysaccharolyticum]